MQPQKLSRYLLVLILPALIWGLAACGGQKEESSASAEPAVIAAETPAKSEQIVAAAPTVAIEPVTDKVEEVEETPELGEPATVMEAAQVLDLRDLPRLADATEPDIEQIGYLQYNAPAEFEAAIKFHRSQLSDLGWQEDTKQEVRVDNEHQKIASFMFEKQGFHLLLEVIEFADDPRGGIHITLVNRGNIDVRALPRYADAEIISEPSATHVMYVTPAKIEEAAEFVRQEFTGLGWQEYTDSLFADTPDSTNASPRFIKNGISLSVTIFTADSPKQAGKTSVSYSVELTAADLPIMADASDIQLNNTGAAYSDKLFVTYTTPADFETVTSFYRQKLAELGWQFQEDNTLTAENQMLLFFEKAETSEAEASLGLSLSQNKAKQTVVALGTIPAGTEEAALEPATEPETETEPIDLETTDLPTSEDIQIESSAQLNAQDLPIPPDAQALTYEADFEEITYTSNLDIKTLVDFYRINLQSQRWQEDEPFSTVEENIALLTFDQGDASLSFTLFNNGIDDSTEVTISASGLAWENAETTDSSEVTSPAFDINSWPIPAEAEEIERSDDEITYIIKWDFNQVAEFYGPSYADLGLDEPCSGDDLSEYTSMSCSTGGSDVSISLNLFRKADGRTEVNFSFYTFGSDIVSDTSETATGEPGELTATEQNDLVIPSDFETNYDKSGFGSEFRKPLNGVSAADLETLIEFYRRELPARGWQEQTDAAVIEASRASLLFEMPGEILTINLSQTAEGTEIDLVQKSPDAAKAQGILPPAGQARVYFIGGFQVTGMTITINQQTVKVPALEAATKPEDAPYLDLAPGEYTYALNGPDQAESSDVIEVGPDESWILIISPDGALANQGY
jgi:hypothetical protein